MSDTTAHPVPLERMLGALLRVPSQAIVARISRDLKRAGFRDLSPAQFNVFQHLPAEGERITELARRAQITKQSMSALVHELETGGYVALLPDERDGRAMVVLRTDRGWEVERIARASIRQLEREWRAALGDDRFQEFRRTLEDLADLIEG